MSINVASISFDRAIIHEIVPRTSGQPYGSAQVTDEILILDSEVEAILRKRIVNSTGKKSKSFELTIGESGEKSFFESFIRIIGSEDETFIEESKTLAYRLGEAHDRVNIPGGMFVLLEGVHNNNLPCVVVIKADHHEALRLIEEDGQRKLEVLKDLILSPSQKLFKIGILYKRAFAIQNDFSGTILSYPSSEYGCILFDDQFNTNFKPAAYFFDTFLGFNHKTNPAIVTNIFYKFVTEFAKTSIPFEHGDKVDNSLKAYIDSNNVSIDVNQFATDFIPAELRAEFLQNAVNKFPSRFLKDNTLVETKKQTKKLSFARDKIKLTLPQLMYDNEDVRVIQDPSDFNFETLTEDSILIVIKPNSNGQEE